MSQARSTVVIVDDDLDTVTVLRDFFDMLGMVAISCPEGADVLDCIAQHQPSVVILDLFLDGVTGVDVLHQLRADPAMRTVPIIFFSGSEDGLRQLLPNYHAYGATFVGKPNIERLSAVVQQLAQQST